MPLPISRRHFLQGSAAIGLPALIATPESAAAWESRADMPIGRSETPAAVLDGWIYVVGGFGADTAAHRYNPAAGLWEQIADYPLPVNHPGAAVLDGRVLVSGGYSPDGRSAYSEIHAYDPADNV